MTENGRPRRGRRPGPIPRGTCPECGNDYALRANRTMGQHYRRTPQGYRLGNCPGIGKPPKDEEAERG